MAAQACMRMRVLSGHNNKPVPEYVECRKNASIARSNVELIIYMFSLRKMNDGESEHTFTANHVYWKNKLLITLIY